ncbi:threonine--tRNA ligase [Candidatus Nomurabacteria bacterium RIFCSPHIGHO2_02_FULL_41_18]|uniref:Threonine--tRNA ligase n=1 Tax=Candidatus Nomurabacteria bacterium RIFCSPHIGHO2_02_FULL_41_18 TaxID=1801754 RepID=A0A1F6W838_9BACT|nr:MAG: threonine--tRNA ligase [Candidatus Nomurabacteria bacterium RIFCSPHIGHO2_01_FULL_41_71]OGI77845.1 MAG: threonine--tRNA ligase [Candidatus Nomurabacteria bacterium RIFCSPHIGHO2_02_FULL_41_18]OGI89995.1 MAG: threonine--tRNA ligase [Candidatus Nomurabacteria bacterium RIFCSPLOWO2_01_FULL_41_52b]OGJ00140.1 MAG: threonine--tRNA ligase [Candidatus Nomurabacteria bacterium RIFCSPLOWO2_02_FULL_41_9]
MEKNEKLQSLRHTLAHLLVAAMRELYPGAKNAIGPAIDDGFYQDFDLPKSVSEEDFPKIEKKMREILKTWNTFDGREVTLEEAKKEFSWNEYKTELIEEFAKDGKKITFYTSGTLVDLCKGGHLENPNKELYPDCFKLDRVAGAYWRGNEKNKMLTRIYGLAFEKKEELEKYTEMREEAEKRDHRKIGQQLGLFTIAEKVGKGLPLFTPKGALLRELLNDYSQLLRAEKGWQKVWSPHITKNDLYKTSGHWDKFGGELFLVKSQETSDELVMKPMNCPHHQQIYASCPHSYRELPIKYMETTTVYRDEKAGELLGLSRVRCITQDDSHTFCTPDQIKQIFQDLIDVTKTFYSAIGMKIRARLSFRDPKTPEKYLGENDLWEKAQTILLDIAKENKLDYFEAPGEAAFYGPKIDFMAIDALGREWQLATPQLDFVQPKRFGLTYIDQGGKEQTPVMIHFALMGSIERFLSVYIEHTAGNFPLWLAPVQIKVIPVRTNHNGYTKEIFEMLRENNIRAELDDKDENLGSKVRDAKTNKLPYWIVIGDKEIASAKVTLESRDAGTLGQMSKEKLLKKLLEETKKKK